MPRKLEEGKMKKGGVNREFQISKRPPDPPPIRPTPDLRPAPGKTPGQLAVEAAKKALAEAEEARRVEFEIERKARLETVYKEVTEFRDKLFREHGVEGNPKAERAYAIAYDFGHAYGMSEVGYYFGVLVELIKPD